MKYLMVLLLCCAALAQTVPVIELTYADAAYTKQLYTDRLEIDAKWFAWQEQVKKTYQPDTAFEFSSDFRFIVPASSPGVYGVYTNCVIAPGNAKMAPIRPNDGYSEWMMTDDGSGSKTEIDHR